MYSAIRRLFKLTYNSLAMGMNFGKKLGNQAPFCTHFNLLCNLKNQVLLKEDLETILMCLRENRQNMRNYVYETLSTTQIR